MCKNNIDTIFSIIIAFILFICYYMNAYGQEVPKLEANNMTSQEVVVYNKGRIRSFVRELGDNEWGVWVEYQPYKPGADARTFRPRTIDQDEANKAIGWAALKYIERKTDAGIVSGYYNFSGNGNYDWKEFAGDNFGTWMQPKYKHPVRIDNEK